MNHAVTVGTERFVRIAYWGSEGVNVVIRMRSRNFTG